MMERKRPRTRYLKVFLSVSLIVTSRYIAITHIVNYICYWAQAYTQEVCSVKEG
jgi:hypothetical protein